MSVQPPNIIPIILAGGAGTRLRPLTGPTRPKPFVKIGRYSLLQHTARRAQCFQNPVVVTAKAFGEQALAELSAIDIHLARIIQEPVALSTGPAIAQAAMSLSPDDVMVVMPSDHFIADSDVFQKTVRQAADIASQGEMVLIGAQPERASTRYGYIQFDTDRNVIKFIEKPDQAAAKEMVRRGGVFWNTGIFVAKVSVFCGLLEDLAPEIYTATKTAHEKSIQSGVFYEPDFFEFVKAPPMAIDYAVMEKLERARVLPLETLWSDLGCWPAFLKAGASHLFS